MEVYEYHFLLLKAITPLHTPTSQSLPHLGPYHYIKWARKQMTSLYRVGQTCLLLYWGHKTRKCLGLNKMGKILVSYHYVMM